MDSIPWEKAQLAAEEKPHYVLEKKPSGHLKEHRAAHWMEWMKRIISMRTMGRVRFAQKFYKSTQIIQIFFLNDINKNRTACLGKSHANI